MGTAAKFFKFYTHDHEKKGDIKLKTHEKLHRTALRPSTLDRKPDEIHNETTQFNMKTTTKPR